MAYVLSDRDAARLQRMLRESESRTDTRYQRRRRHGGGGGGGPLIAYCKTDAPDSDEITCYLRVNLAARSGSTSYSLNDWVEVAGVEYRSLQDNNLGHAVSEPAWWEAGTISVTVKCQIANGSSLMYATPFLTDGQPILVQKINGIWYCTNNLFVGGRFMS